MSRSAPFLRYSVSRSASCSHRNPSLQFALFFWTGKKAYFVKFSQFCKLLNIPISRVCVCVCVSMNDDLLTLSE